MRSGRGAQTWIDGSSYVGSWEDDAPHGWGTHYFNNGNQAQGALVNGTYDGQGLHFRWGDGTIFKCKELARCFDDNNLIRENGTFVPRRQTVRRRSGAKRGRRNQVDETSDGWAVRDGNVYFLNGDRYDGPLEAQIMHGRGTYYWRDGRKFEGDFSHGLKEGQGQFWGTDLKKYIGEFVNDKIEGFGVMEMPDGQIYTGHFANWTRFGTGNLTWRNGDVFVGEWTDDHSGNGTITYSDGTEYIGQWRGDKRHGHGEMRQENPDFF